MTEATLTVHRPAAGFRYSHGRYDVQVDGVKRGDLGVGDTVELSVEPGSHELQVVRSVYSTGGITEFGSPVLPLELAEATTTSVEARPSGAPASSFRVNPQAMLTLVAVGPTGTVMTEIPLRVRQPGGFARNGVLTRSLVAKRRPWWSWQAAVSLIMISFCVFVVVSDLTHRPGSVRWFPVIFFGACGTLLVSDWVSLYRARRATSTP